MHVLISKECADKKSTVLDNTRQTCSDKILTVTKGVSEKHKIEKNGPLAETETEKSRVPPIHDQIGVFQNLNTVGCTEKGPKQNDTFSKNVGIILTLNEPGNTKHQKGTVSATFNLYSEIVGK